MKELTDQKITVYGQIKNYNQNSNQKTIGFNFQTLENVKSDIKIANINANGEFEIETTIAWPQDFFFEYGDERFYFICEPNDSFRIEIDNGIWNENEDDKIKCVSVIGGSAVANNKFVNAFISRVDNSLKHCISYENVKNLEANEYKNFVLSQKKEADKTLHMLLDTLNTTPLFEKWARNYINHYVWSSLLRYHIWHTAYNNIDRFEFEIPVNYYSFLDDFDMYYNEVISTHQEGFYHEYSIYLDELLPLDSLEKQWELFDTDVISYFSSSIEQRAKFSSGFTSDIIIYEIYSRMLDWSFIAEWETIYQPKIFNYQYFAKKIEAKYTQIKEHIENPIFTENLNFIFNNNQILESLLDTIHLKYQDKVIYINFWSPSCGPCLQEIPSSIDLQMEYQDENVIFLNLASGCKEEAWKAKISEKQLSGEHLLLNNDQFRNLQAKFEITGTPHYVLIDKKQNVILKNAPRPSNKEIRKEINNLLID
ncbi:MAG TPA: TlpA disulfide reductase family protein [Edaphocola sp.]|nr:TlpA disulfide reductase family protein [Edaphocola sp.]